MATDPYSRLKRFASGVGQVVECVGYVVLKKAAYTDGTRLTPDDLVPIRGRVNLEETVKIVELAVASDIERLIAHRDVNPAEDVVGYVLIGDARLPKNATLGDAKARSNGEIQRIFIFDRPTQPALYGMTSLHLLFLK